jgi:predicted RNA-binding Zn-ribbon protein involved in translation (DUF1610 family)
MVTENDLKNRFKVIKLQVKYKSGYGGAHSEQGLYRTNPINNKDEFIPWVSLGYPLKSYTTTEFVCSECGKQLISDDIVSRICSDCSLELPW